MANQASCSSSPSASVSTSYPRYDVFINHRGPDVKNTFAAHLYRRLLDHGLRVFLDKPELLQGHRITPQIEAAIQVASVHVAIFSPSYAESKWCLEELVLMLKSKATILPVFYKVEPYQLRWTVENGEYAKALRKLEEKTTVDSKTGEKKPRHNSETIQNWRSALSQAAEISGFNLDCDEEELLNKVLQGVLKSVSKLPLYVAKYPTGVEDKLQDFEREVLQRHEQQVEAKVVGIVGFGGVGKTTLAKAFFNRKRSDYKESSFLFDVREQSINYLQTKLIEDLKHTTIKIQSPDEWIEILKEHLSSCEALIILDNVDKAYQLEMLLPMKDILGPESLVLVTTRDKHLLKQWGVLESSIYNMTGLNMPHSQELFCSYAFFKRFSPPEFAELVDQFVTACGGLPLSLKVIGALLCGENDELYWNEQFDRLQQSLPEEIQKTLRISYDSLVKEDQEVFLDIACFFLGEYRDKAIRIWGLLGIRNLENKCLLEVDSESKIRMHDHIRDCARNIAEEGSMPRRLWHPTTNIIDDFLEQSPSLITEVRGITTVSSSDGFFRGNKGHQMLHYISEMPQKKKKTHIHGMKNLQFVATEDGYLEGIVRGMRSPHLTWLRWYGCSDSSLPDWIPMKNLKVLEVQGRKFNSLWPPQSQGPLQLRELNIEAPLSEFPKSIGQLKYLESISINAIHDFSYSNSPIQIQVETLPQEFCQLCSLKYMVLKGFSRLMSLPFSFGKLTNLQYIDLDGASRLQMLPNSFGDLSRLKHLSLEECSSLTISNGTLGNITTLEYLNLRGCRNVKELPPQVAHQRSLEKLYLRHTNLKELPSGLGDLCNLEVLEIGDNSSELLPSSVGYLKSLKYFSIYGWPKLKCLPDSFGPLTQLTELRLVRCGIEFLPEGLLKLNNLNSLRVQECPLQELPFKTVEGETETLSLTRGKALNKLVSANDKCMFGLTQLWIQSTKISEVAFPEGVCPNLQFLYLKDCQEVRQIRGLCGLSKLDILCIEFCVKVDVLCLENLRSLTDVTVTGCLKLKCIRGLAQLLKLDNLWIEASHEIVGLEGAEHCMSLSKLNIWDCPKLNSIPWLGQLTKLQVVYASGCHELVGFPGVEHCMSLRYLEASDCPKLQWGGGVLEKLRGRLGHFKIDVKPYKRRKLCVE